MYPEPPDQPAEFPQMFQDELKRIRAWRKNRNVPVPAGHIDLFGLAFSGGGIRSATFNLGVLQALAKHKILHHVDYLSTVSGGGYIGSWLNALIYRHNMADTEDGLNPDDSSAHRRTLPARRALAHLRAYSNYLTPKMSMLSADTWTLWAIWGRNTLLHVTTLITAIASLILLGQMIGLRAVHYGGYLWELLPLPFFLIAAVTLGLNLNEKLPAGFRGDQWVQILVVLPAFAGSIVLTLVNGKAGVDDVLEYGIILSVLFLLLQFVAGFWACFQRQHEHPLSPAANILLQVLTAAASGFLTSWIFYGLSRALNTFDPNVSWPIHRWLVLTVGPPAVVIAISLGVVANVGLMGRDIPDSTREWLGRLGAWASVYIVGWLAFFGVAFFGPYCLRAGWLAAATWVKTTVTAAWVGTSIGGLLEGKSSKTGDKHDGDAPSSYANILATIGPYVFMVGFITLIGLVIHVLTLQPVKPEASLWATYWQEMKAQQLWAPSADWYQGLMPLFLLSTGMCLLSAWRVDINEFSLHHFYKNRLVRCYLGASRDQSKRRPNPFTNFDPHDDLPLCHLDDPKFSGPFPIINATLNLSSGRNLAWQERKGASFVFTPLYSGYDTGRDDSGTAASRQMRVGAVAAADDAVLPANPHVDRHSLKHARPDGVPAYYPTQFVSRMKPDAHFPRFRNTGIAVGTTVAISGAAGNPNSGFHTSTAVAFLMTVFNVRLGWWLGNPVKPSKAFRSGPTFGLLYTLAELFGTTDADSAFVNLSDGGHFDNMGLYELVRRRCRFIILCDAEQDDKLAFGGLATAIRMCRTDFGAEISICLDQLKRSPDNRLCNFSACDYAIGTIRYQDRTDNPDGILVYLKSSLTGKEPADILGYHNIVPQFPHESTADQWFDETQFESYRRLGLFVGEQALTSGGVDISAGPLEFFSSLKPCRQTPAAEKPGTNGGDGSAAKFLNAHR